MKEAGVWKEPALPNAATTWEGLEDRIQALAGRSNAGALWLLERHPRKTLLGVLLVLVGLIVGLVVVAGQDDSSTTTYSVQSTVDVDRLVLANELTQVIGCPCCCHAALCVHFHAVRVGGL